MPFVGATGLELAHRKIGNTSLVRGIIAREEGVRPLFSRQEARNEPEKQFAVKKGA